MAHDVILARRSLRLARKPIDGIFLAALMTIIGYSVNDTVVVFDRIRELLGVAARRAFTDVANPADRPDDPAHGQHRPRRVFILGALAFLGGDSLTDFAIALLVGIVVGTYSSMFTAGPLAIELERRSPSPPPPAKRTAPARPRYDRDSSGAVV